MEVAGSETKYYCFRYSTNTDHRQSYDYRQNTYGMNNYYSVVVKRALAKIYIMHNHLKKIHVPMKQKKM